MAEDLLALSLEKAAANPAYKPQFGQVMLASTIYVMGEIEGEDPARRPQAELNAGSRVAFRSQRLPNGKTIVPFFSSLENLRAFIEGPEEVAYLVIPATTLFELARGANFVLNPSARIRGEFAAEEIAKLMATRAKPDGVVRH